MRIKKRMGMVMCSFVIAVTSVTSYVCIPGVVTFAAEAISLNYSQLMLAIGESEELTLFGTEAVSFVSSKPSVAEVSGTGLITAKKQGTATVTAKGANGKKVWNDSVTYKYDKRGNVIEQVVNRDVVDVTRNQSVNIIVRRSKQCLK